ncbi:hypothetical protein QT972_19180 [Microcoleus sp. herbarium7]
MPVHKRLVENGAISQFKRAIGFLKKSRSSRPFEDSPRNTGK